MRDPWPCFVIDNLSLGVLPEGFKDSQLFAFVDQFSFDNMFELFFKQFFAPFFLGVPCFSGFCVPTDLLPVDLEGKGLLIWGVWSVLL